MNKDKQRIAIAKACGWKLADENEIKERAGTAAWLLEKGPWWRNAKEKTIATIETLPDYCNDLNAMHEAEKHVGMQEYPLREHYCLNLMAVKNNQVSPFPIWMTSAAQRAEAFLKTLNLWEDE